MKMKLLLNGKLLKASALLSLSVLSLNSAVAQTNVTVDTAAEWKGAMLCYLNTPGQEYEWFSEWGLADVKTEVNTTNSTIELYPNYNTYDATDAYWSNGEAGNKILQGLSFIETSALANQNFTFSGQVVSTTLSSAYEVEAFVKVFNDNFTVTLAEFTQDLDEVGNFTIYANSMQEGAVNVQYGFSVRGINANPTTMAANGFMVVAADVAMEPEEPGAVTVSINAETPVIGYANWFDLNEAYIGGNEYGVADLKTVINTAENYMDLHPNFLAYGDGTNPEWANNGMGTRIFEGNTYVDDASLIGETVTFEGKCISNTLAEGYDGIAFIKVLDAGYQLVNYTTAPLVTGEDFSITVTPAQYPGGVHFQYGYSVTGVNANPNQEAALGFARVGEATSSVTSFAKKAVALYPNPATNVLNLEAQDIITSLEVYNLMGQKVMQAQPNQTAAAINVSGLTSGVYIVNTTVNGTKNSVRFIKQ